MIYRKYPKISKIVKNNPSYQIGLTDKVKRYSLLGCNIQEGVLADSTSTINNFKGKEKGA